MTRNQWIAVTVPIVAALIGAGALLLSSSDGVENNCSNTALCAGHDNNVKNSSR